MINLLWLNSLFNKFICVVTEKNKTENYYWHTPDLEEIIKQYIKDFKFSPPVIDTRWPPSHWIDLVKNGQDIPLSDFSWYEILTNMNLLTHSIIQYWCFIPEITIFFLILIIILVREWDFKFLFKFTLVFFNLLYIFNIISFFTFPPYVHFFFGELVANDNYLFLIKAFIFLLFQFFLLILYHRFFDKKNESLTIIGSDKSHYKIVYSLYLSFLFLSLILISINDFFGFYIILEGLSFSLVFSCVLNFNKTYHILTSIRYFVYNLYVSGGLLLGIAFLYGLLGTTNFFYCKMLLSSSSIEISSTMSLSFDAPIATTVSLLQAKSLIVFIALFFFGCFFKLGCFPFNTWILTINQMISYEVSFLFNIIFKNLFFFVFFRICTYYLAPIADYWSILLLFFGYCSVFIGTLGAFGQKRIKSFLTFSSVVQMGYNLIGISLTTFHSFASVFYLQFIYIFSNVIIIGCLLYLSCDPLTFRSSRWRIKNIFYVLTDLQLLRQVSPLFAIAVTIAFLSMAGLPPTLGFFAKYYYYEVLIECGMYELCVVLILLNGLSLYYYINVLKNIWLSVGYDAFNTIYIPWFNKELFMTLIIYIFCIINICAVFISKHILFLASKLSWIGSRIVFGQVHLFLMKFPLFRYLYSKSVYLITEKHVSSYIDKFDSIQIYSDTPSYHFENKYINPEFPDWAQSLSLFERDMLCDKIINRNIFPEWLNAYEDYFSSEWIVYTSNAFTSYQFMLFVLLVLTAWSFYVIYILKLDRLILSHPTVGSYHISFNQAWEILKGPYGFPIWWTTLFILYHLLWYFHFIR